MAGAHMFGGPSGNAFSGVSDSGDDAVTAATATAISDAVTATPTGGLSPFAHAWTYVSGDVFTINSPAAATTTFTATGLSHLEQRIGLYKDTVTDGNGISRATRNIQISLGRS